MRLIHNLKKLNSFVEKSHFKMEFIHTVLNLVTPTYWMASLDLKDAYFSVECIANVIAAITLFENLGLVIHRDPLHKNKSLLICLVCSNNLQD